MDNFALIARNDTSRQLSPSTSSIMQRLNSLKAASTHFSGKYERINEKNNASIHELTSAEIKTALPARNHPCSAFQMQGGSQTLFFKNANQRQCYWPGLHSFSMRELPPIKSNEDTTSSDLSDRTDHYAHDGWTVCGGDSFDMAKADNVGNSFC